MFTCMDHVGQFCIPALAVLPKQVLREGKCQETQMGDLVRCRIGCGLGGFTLTGDKFLKGNVSMTPPSDPILLEDCFVGRSFSLAGTY